MEPDAKQDEKPSLNIWNQIPQIEAVVNKTAIDIAKVFGIPSHHFHIYLVREFNEEIKTGQTMKVIGGHEVRVLLKWPEILPEIGTAIRDAFSAMNKYGLRRSMEVVPFALSRQWIKDARKKWERDYFTDESQIILDLLPKSRLQQTVSETVTIEDVVTGEKISITKSSKPTKFDGDDMNLWMQISRQVKAKHPEVDTFDTEDTFEPAKEA